MESEVSLSRLLKKMYDDIEAEKSDSEELAVSFIEAAVKIFPLSSKEDFINSYEMYGKLSKILFNVFDDFMKEVNKGD